jgi:hypothetical protein
LILKAMVVDAEYDEGPAIAIVPLSQARAQRGRDLFALAQELAGRVASFYQFEVFDCTPTWLQGHDALEAALGSHQYVVLSRADFAARCDIPAADWDLWAVEFADTVRPDCPTIEVGPDGLRWRAYIKHTDPPVSMKTADLSAAFLHELMPVQPNPTAPDDRCSTRLVELIVTRDAEQGSLGVYLGALDLAHELLDVVFWRKTSPRQRKAATVYTAYTARNSRSGGGYGYTPAELLALLAPLGADLAAWARTVLTAFGWAVPAG